MKLGFSLADNGSHKAGWRHPDANEGIAVDFDVWTQIALAAERGKFHYVFFADGQAVRLTADTNDKLSCHGRIEQFEPLTLIAGLAARTTHLGFVATASTSYKEPYTVARKFASLDQMSSGRVGWNVVTTWSEIEAQNFSRTRNFEHSERYRRAEEFVDDHRLVVGTPVTVADQLEEWFAAGACDGFSLMVPYMPTPLYEIVDWLVPELQRRGLFRTEYEGRTLRENMGLAVPGSKFA